jgi:hypothetical protein
MDSRGRSEVTAKRQKKYDEIGYLMNLIRYDPPLSPRAQALQQRMRQAAQEKQTDAQPRLLKDGDSVCNINPASQHYQRVGVFRRYLPEWTFCHGPGCDVEYPGISGPHGYPYVAQSANDLERIMRRKP